MLMIMLLVVVVVMSSTLFSKEFVNRRRSVY